MVQPIKNIYLLKCLEFYSKSQNATVSPKGLGTMKRKVTHRLCDYEAMYNCYDKSDSESPRI